MDKANKELTEWEKRLSERISKGIPVKEWCQKHGYTKDQYYYWKRKVSSTKQAAETGFTEVKVKYEAAADTENRGTELIRANERTGYTIKYKDLSIAIPEQFSAVSLKELLKVVKAL
ncbi:hypothetical protein EOM86_10875 [Candidatus Nomurabacteria bacterium]|nr:hypothetical protein [Candidatus Nomurabacteria bacterium]